MTKRLKSTAAALAISFGAFGFGILGSGGLLATMALAADVTESDYAEPSNLVTKNLLVGAARAGDRLVGVGEFGHVILSDDGGATWRQARSVPTRATLTSVYFVDAKTGWAGGHDTTVIKTIDGGETWMLELDRAISDNLPAPPPVASPDNPITAPDDAAADEELTGLEEIYAGDEASEMQPDTPVLTVVFADANIGFAAGAFGYAAQTLDSGATWTRRRLSDAALDDYHLNGAFAGPNGSLFIAAEQGYVYRSLDKGATWEMVVTGYDGSFWSGLALNDGSLLVFGMRGNIWRSTDMGSDWTRVPSGTPESLASGVQLADGRVVIVGLGGVVAVSSDNGMTWSVTSRSDRKGLSSVVEAKPGEIAIFGEMGVAVQAVASGS